MSDTAKSQALAKIEQGLKKYKGTIYTNELKHFIADMLMNFCEQQEEFARAVLDGGTLQECVTHIEKKIKEKNMKGAVEDALVYSIVAAFYFPGCVTEYYWKMSGSDTMEKWAKIHMSTFEAEEPQAGGISLNLEDFL